VTLAAGPALATPGAQLWAKRYNGPAAQRDEANAIAVNPDGSMVFSTGLSQGSSTSPDYATVAADASTGARLWVKRYDGPIHLDDEAQDIDVSPDGSTVFVTGFSQEVGLRYASATIAYDASTGAEVWIARYSPSDSYSYALALSPDGSTVFVTGTTYGSTTRLDYATVAFDASTGAKLWARRFDGPLNSADQANALAVSSDSSMVFVTGYSYGLTQTADYATVAYDATTGAKRWVSRYKERSNANEEALGATAVGVSPDGSMVFVTGQSRTNSTSNDYGTVAYDASTGTKLWGSRYDGPPHGSDSAFALGVSPDGTTVFVTGSSAGATNWSNYGTVAYDTGTGTTMWVRRYNGPGDLVDQAKALGVSPNGSMVFATGFSQGSSTGYDFATVAYDASTGHGLWFERFDGPAHSSDLASDIGVGPHGGRVYVTGYGDGATSAQDYVTVAYATA
jgi:hypothetical protein